MNGIIMENSIKDALILTAPLKIIGVMFRKRTVVLITTVEIGIIVIIINFPFQVKPTESIKITIVISSLRADKYEYIFYVVIF